MCLHFFVFCICLCVGKRIREICVMRMYCYLIHDKKKKVVAKKGKDYNLNNGIWWQRVRVKLYDDLIFD